MTYEIRTNSLFNTRRSWSVWEYENDPRYALCAAGPGLTHKEAEAEKKRLEDEQ